MARLNRRPTQPTLGRLEPSWLAAEQAPYYLLLGTAAFLLGLVMVLSASSVTSYAATGSSFAVVQKQLLWAAVGLPAAWVATRLPPAAYRRAAYPLLLVSVVLLAAVQVPGLGRTVNGNRNWLALGGLSLQPSELAKLALILWSADLLARKARLLGRLRHLLVPLMPAGLGLLALVLAGGDLGTSIVLIAILGGLLYLAGAPGRVFAAFGVLAAAGVVAMIVYEPYRMARVTALFHPGADPTGAGYQGLQGSYALASGGWWGVGLGASVAKWGFLPEAHTDFIFAIIGEELGLAGTLCVLVLFALVTYAGCRIALAASPAHALAGPRLSPVTLPARPTRTRADARTRPHVLHCVGDECWCRRILGRGGDPNERAAPTGDDPAPRRDSPVTRSSSRSAVHRDQVN